MQSRLPGAHTLLSKSKNALQVCPRTERRRAPQAEVYLRTLGDGPSAVAEWPCDTPDLLRKTNPGQAGTPRGFREG
jgi:hypothetical protein